MACKAATPAGTARAEDPGLSAAREAAEAVPAGKRPLGTPISVYQDLFCPSSIYKKMTLVKFHPFLLFCGVRDFLSPTSFIIEPFF